MQTIVVHLWVKCIIYAIIAHRAHLRREAKNLARTWTIYATVAALAVLFVFVIVTLGMIAQYMFVLGVIFSRGG